MKVLADWKIESNYPPQEGTLLSRWHWEFLRRNKQYQDDFDLYQELKLDPDTCGQRENISRKYGLDGIMLDYRDELESLFQTPRKNLETRMVQWQTTWIGEDEKGNLIEGKSDQLDYLDPKIRQHECCVVFNLRNELEQQLIDATSRLNKLKQKYMEKRGDVKNYSYYLRLLDADLEGINKEELVLFFMPEVEEAFAMKKIKNDLQEAKRLRDIGYQYI